MADERSFRVLMEELTNGREAAAAEIVEEYTAALIAVARREISPKLARRVDPWTASDRLLESVGA